MFVLFTFLAFCGDYIIIFNISFYFLRYVYYVYDVFKMLQRRDSQNNNGL